jgi:hypothetical protein
MDEQHELSSKAIGFVCVTLTIVLWVAALITDPTAGPIGAALALTAIVAFVGTLSSTS